MSNRTPSGNANGADAGPAAGEFIELFGCLARHLEDVLWVTNADGSRILYLSPAVERLWGSPPEAFYRDPSLWLQAIHPTHRERVRRAFAEQAAKGTFDEEYLVQNPSGGWRWIRDRGVPVYNGDERVRRIAGIAEDITARKEAEQSLVESEAKSRLLLEKLPAITYRVALRDGIGHTTYISPQVQSILGFSPEEWTADPQLWIRQLHPDDCSRIVSEVCRKNDTGESFHLEYRALARDGHVVWLHNDAEYYRDVHGVLRYVHGVMVDVSERKRAEEQLRQRDAELRHAHKMHALGRLAGGIAHDFNNLLTVILGCGRIVRDELDPRDPLHDEMTEVVQAAARAERLTRQLLAFSQKQALCVQPVDLNDAVREMHQLLRRTLCEDIDLRLALQADPAIVRADPGQVEQVILNLAVNAGEAMPRGGKLTIGTRHVTWSQPKQVDGKSYPAGDYVELAVEDDGCGMEEEVRQQVCDPFYTTKPHGTGQGLSTVYGIVHQCEGFMKVESEPGVGTTIRIVLPAAARDVPSPAIPPAPVSEARGSETILVVEDEEAVRHLTGRMLKSLGYQPLLAANAGEGLLICEDHDGPIHLVLADVVMPGMDGLRLAKRLRTLRPDMKVLFTSGFPDDVLHGHGVADTQTLLLQKPYRKLDLGRKIREVLDA